MNKRSFYNMRSRSSIIILGLALSFVASGCGVLKNNGDDIGDGYLSAGGWDPFDGEPRRQKKSEDPEDYFVDNDDAPVPAEAPLGEIAVDRESKSSAAKRLEAQFKKGDYDKALASAKQLRSKSKPGSSDRDLADFVIGASQYYNGDFTAAQATLDAHVSNFPNSRQRESALYYQASNHVRLRQWRVGASLLDNFISSYPESLLLEFALFDRATCHDGLGEYSSAISMINRFQREYIYSKIRDRALALKGDAQKEKGDLAGAQASYQAGREAADELKHPDIEARCLANLTTVAAKRGQNSTAVKYYKAFFKNYAKSSYATEAALGGLPALKATGDLDSGLKNLERVLQQMPQRTDASVFNRMLTEYSKFYREKNGADELLQQLGNMSSDSKGSARFKEQLIVARLEALETYFPNNDAEIRVFYKEIRSRFKPSELSATNVLKIADYIAETKPADAVPWYQNALSRGSSIHQARATLGLAKAEAMLGKSNEAEKGFRKVLETFGSPELAEEATVGMARIASKKKDWSASAYYWGNYLDQKTWTTASAEARAGLDEAKSRGGVAKAPTPTRTMPVKAQPQDPVSKEFAKAESLLNAGKKEAAYATLETMIQRYGDSKNLPKAASTALSKASIMREDLGIELGK